MSKKYKLVIKSSLVDDYAPDLIRNMVENVDADITIIANLATKVKAVKREFEKTYNEKKFEDRCEHVKSFANVEFFDSNKFYENRSGWKSEHDGILLGMLKEINPDSVFDIGYMIINSDELWQTFLMPNLHPAIPEIGPKGMWTNVMEQQAERPLEEIGKMGNCPDIELAGILGKREYRAGGMVSLLDWVIDRGPVISWYEFSLDSPELLRLFRSVSNIVGKYGIETARRINEYPKLGNEIRRCQYEGENPLIILSYKKFVDGEWKIVESDEGENKYYKNRTLYVKENGLWKPYPNGYCMNREIGEWLRERGIKSLIK
jgi:folate-dependent phosphoribosylglycinamide formyltransferase PurN